MDKIENYTFNVDHAGRVLIPANLRKALGIQPGGKLDACVSGREIRLRNLHDRILEAQAFAKKHDRMPGVSAVDMLLAERRQEAEKE